ncbi:hypothetical protein NEHOM01_2518 [Nematocida homosporus]|uniref:uncharacterized protein n=1 Tax=Nematocida homosporus TaxID=1912981 RepID=UPI00221EF03D|nr:uncharacterized protein NEHOM01_2518 [Nematocida homosporus]KAI5188077.1 hypothetical protein NEHOM01_2518 [Nematocida homosporus]
MSTQLNEFYVGLKTLETVEPASAALNWVSVRNRLSEIFRSADTPRWEVPHFKKGDAIFKWAVYVSRVYSLNLITWAQIVKAIEKTVPHTAQAGKVFDPTKPDIERFVQICKALAAQEKAGGGSPPSLNRKTGNSLLTTTNPFKPRLYVLQEERA